MYPDDYREEDYDNVGWFGPYPHKKFGWRGMCGQDENEENLEYGWGEQSKNNKKPMGDMADMIVDSCLEDDSDELYDIGYYNKPRKQLKCRSCKKEGLSWRKISGQWVMMENSGAIHICEGYEPPVEVLKIVANEVISETKKNIIWKIKEKSKERGGLTKLINILPDDQLLDLYTSFVKDEQRNYDEPDVGMGIPSAVYGREISFLKKEILRRMNR